MDQSGSFKEGPFARWNHEYWPWYLIYLPVLPVLLWNAIRARSMVFFTNVNPSIDLAGFFGERKSEIYDLLPKGSYPTTVLIQPGTSVNDVQRIMRDSGLTFPLIMKPDVGERGQGVARVADEATMRTVLGGMDRPTLLQGLITGQHEFGLMFARDPRTNVVTTLSITGKRFLEVEGDGHATVEELLGRTYRGSKQVERLRGYKTVLLNGVPSVGKHLMVEPIGNHCRGTTFLDASGLRTPELEAVMSRLIQAAEGIYYGRLDVRAESIEAFQQGYFSIVELNGVSSEPGHIYDPSMSILRCWSELIRHVRYIPRISAQLRQRGHEPVTFRVLLLRCGTHFDPSPFWRWVIRVFAGSRSVQAQQVLRPRPGTSF